jgi:hypothetical protein
MILHVIVSSVKTDLTRCTKNFQHGCSMDWQENKISLSREIPSTRQGRPDRRFRHLGEEAALDRYFANTPIPHEIIEGPEETPTVDRGGHSSCFFLRRLPAYEPGSDAEE